MFLYLISMNDLTKEERAVAAAQNWGLFHIFDMDRSRWVMNVLPLQFVVSAPVMLGHVVNQAKMGHQVSIKALQVMAQFNKGTK